MNHQTRAMLTEALLAGKTIEEYLGSAPLLEEDDADNWVSGVSYWSDYVTIIDLNGKAFGQAS
ncbi:MAG TPA: hypothetical protein VME46_13955 [Acidimicrobiales bacterium]|nr:hypothetical protein [Acidimicrobiales bacterium]